MEIVVVVKMVPDLVEELEIDADGHDLDRSFLKLRLNEFDEHAVEEALQLKERHGGRVTVIALDAGEVDETLFTCVAKGVDRAVKVRGDFAPSVPSHAAAAVLASVIRSMPHDLILTGVQAADDRDGQVGILLAEALGLPHVSVVSGVEPAGERTVTARQEYAGGVMAEFEVDLPCVLGIQAAREAPRYAPVSKIRQAMKTAKLEELEAGGERPTAGSTVIRMSKPESGAGAEMLEGSPEEVADRLLRILRDRGFVKA
ncbi:MAG: electron transfer flavoprotein subunit beta/FixA family protein [Candidatus Rokubacteria bacterium]|nr:electron transfer flavoprotein subunit beta/FixA family protein [Candidatus Rokubacteria bacterium]